MRLQNPGSFDRLVGAFRLTLTQQLSSIRCIKRRYPNNKAKAPPKINSKKSMVLGNKFSRFPLPLQQSSQPTADAITTRRFFLSFFFLPHRLLQKTVPVARVRTVDGDAPSRGPFAKTGRYQRNTALEGQDSKKDGPLACSSPRPRSRRGRKTAKAEGIQGPEAGRIVTYAGSHRSIAALSETLLMKLREKMCVLR
jgi:hypothetical protein